MRLLLLLPAFLLGALGWCGVTVTFPSPGAHAVWTAPDLSTPPDDALSTEETMFEFEGVLNEYLLVLDKATGNIAYRRTRDVGAKWDVKDEDYKMVAEVAVRVEFEGKAIANASIRVNNSTPKGIGPGSDGLATFRNVRIGDANVEASFENDKGRPRVRSQKFPIGLEREQKVPKLIFALSDRVKTIEPPKELEPAGDPKPATPVKTSIPGRPSSAGAGNMIGNLLVFLLVLGGLVALLWLALRWITQNQDKAKDALTKVGVPIDPLPADPATSKQSGDPPPAPPMAQPEPPQPIVLPSAPDPAPVQPIVMASPLAAPGETRMVGPNGMSFAIHEGTSVIGRDDGLALSLTGESTVSRRHAEITRQAGVVLVVDTGSTNGTFVNGRRIDAPTQVHPGDEVQFGAVRFRLE